MPEISQRIATSAPYPFAELDRIKTELKTKGIDVIDFGVGDPVDPTPAFIREAAQAAIDTQAASGYPSYTGSASFLAGVATWFAKRFGVQLDPATEITSSIGSKEAIFNFPLAYVDKGDIVLIPTPGYPPYTRGTQFAGGQPYFLPLLPENNFLIDFAKIPAAIAAKAKILWLNYPNSPTGAVATDEFYQQAVEFCQRNDIVLASDLAYSEIYYDQPPKSVLEFTRKGVIEFHSLSKRSRMTGYRVGYAVGDSEVITALKQVKTNVDSGTPNFIQDAAIAALGDEEHVAQSRAEYQEKRDLLVGAFTELGLEKSEPQATFYVWQRVPAGLTSAEFAKRLLAPELGIVATPGSWISDTTADSQNPGEGFVRFALVPTVEQVREAAQRIGQYLKL